MTAQEMVQQEKLLRLKAAILERAAWACRKEAAALEERRLQVERLATPIAVVRPSGRTVPNSKSAVVAHNLATAAAKAFGLSYAQAYQMVARAS